MNTIDILLEISKIEPNIKAYSFHLYNKQSLVQERISDWKASEQKIFDSAMRFKKQYCLPFWDGIMLSSFNQSCHSDSFLEAALHHNSIDNLKFIDTTEICELFQLKQQRIAVNSQVKMIDGSIRHLPMLDFHIPVSDNHIPIIYKVCKCLELPDGYILNSGESYHYIGITPIEWETLYIILCKALLYSPIIDKAWISHQLIEKSCSLRIGQKNGIDTQVVTKYP